MNEMKNKASILIVDDTVENLKLLSSMLGANGYEARPVPSGKLALAAIENQSPDLILLDIKMPEMSGYDVCRRLKANESTREIPVIFISALDETIDKIEAFKVGGVDYVTKPFQFEEVRARLETHLDLRRTHIQLEQSYERLKELEQLRDSLVHMIIHDMGSPLMGILGNIELLRDDLLPQLTSKTRARFENMVNSSNYLKDMTRDLLDVSKLEEGRMPLERTHCSLAEVAMEAVENVRIPASNRSIEVEIPSSIAVSCDKNLVRRTVENLVTNGLKYTPRDKSLKISTLEEAERIRVAVRDEGAGIPVEYREKIFEKFGTMIARRDQQYHSVGLGLAFCKLAIEAHGGQIGVESQEGEGSTFWFTLPRA